MSAATLFARELPVANAMLGNKVIVEGHIRSQEDLIIEGEVEGTIEMMEHRLTIAANGKVRANVKAREIEVLGSIQGKIEAVEKVYIRKSAHLIGDIHSAGIIVEDGGYIKGSIELSRLPADSQNERTPPSSLEARWLMLLTTLGVELPYRITRQTTGAKSSVVACQIHAGRYDGSDDGIL